VGRHRGSKTHLNGRNIGKQAGVVGDGSRLDLVFVFCTGWNRVVKIARYSSEVIL
jgi:hypothetical protein